MAVALLQGTLMKNTAYLFSAYIAGASHNVDSAQFYKHIASYSNTLNSLVQHTAKPTKPGPHPKLSALALQE